MVEGQVVVRQGLHEGIHGLQQGTAALGGHQQGFGGFDGAALPQGLLGENLPEEGWRALRCAGLGQHAAAVRQGDQAVLQGKTGSGGVVLLDLLHTENTGAALLCEQLKEITGFDGRGAGQRHGGGGKPLQVHFKGQGRGLGAADLVERTVQQPGHGDVRHSQRPLAERV